MELTAKALLSLFQDSPRTVDFLRRVNRLSLALLERSPRPRAAAGETVVGEAGVNVAGYITSESGMGEAVRGNILSLRHTSIPFVLNNLSSFASQKDSTYSGFASKNPYAVNLIHVTAEQAPVFYREQGTGYFRGKYNIGVWYWELETFPEIWKDRFDYFQEIWVATEFCRKAVAEQSPVPVIKVPPALAMVEARQVDKKQLGFGGEEFIFLCMFSFLSVVERKNPFAVIEAFKRAFKPGEPAALLIKFSHGNVNPRAKAQMQEASRGINVRLLDQEMRKDEISSLLASTDCFVSLHRSEGFGLPLAEAMLLKKPVIATAYSGNTDFMNRGNSYPVGFRMVELDRDYGPYKKGNVWADPDINEAAALMRDVFEHRDRARMIGEKAGRDVAAQFDPAKTGRMIADRIAAIARDHALSLPAAIRAD